MVADRSARALTTAIKLERTITLIFAGLEIIIHGGAIWGWPSYVYVLKQDGFFSDLCHTDEGVIGGAVSLKNGTYHSNLNSTHLVDPIGSLRDFDNEKGNSHNVSSGTLNTSGCNDQDAIIQLIFTVAMGTYLICSCWLMNIIDRFGIRCARILIFVGCLVSYILLAVATPKSSFLLFPAMIILTSCGSVLLTANQQVGNLFGRGKSTVMSWLNGCLSASVIVFFLLKIAHDHGIPAQHSFIFLAGITLLMLVNTVMMPKKRIPWPLPDGYRLGTCLREQPSSGYGDISKQRKSGHLRGTHDLGHTDEAKGSCPDGKSTTIKKQSHFHDIQEWGESLKRQRYPNFRACVTSLLFWLVVHWFGFIQLNVLFLFGTFNSHISRLAGGDLRVVSGYTDVFLLLQIIPVFLSQPLGLLMDRNKVKLCRKGDGESRGPFDDLKDICLPLALTTITSISYSACLLVPHLHVQYVTFTLVLIVMSVLWGYLSATTAIIFPMKIFSTLVGSFRTLGGIIAFLQFPLFRMIQNYLQNDPSYVIIGLIVADITTFALPVYIWYFVKKQAKVGRMSATEQVNV
ncbi:solute carrier family 43 member 3-like [Lytechinus variegatus]|uniref:solute carrier family 43 member 3-like n=1 Tax=Lytechinus variegatus TaxID=7654 RepID=UPI001BB184BB|nr:solute carrier family 43 member 3-like [Lytechinus variegatus]